MSRQLTFDWPAGVALGADDFFVSEANAAARDLIGRPADWPGKRLAIIGPDGSGKSHLAHIFAETTGARVLTPAMIEAAGLPDGPVVVEDADRGLGPAEEALFHLYNHLGAAGHPLLLTARAAPARWAVGLPDLASRLATVQLAEIGVPDDALLGALITKLFADRQIAPRGDVVAFLVPRLERSFAAVSRVVDTLDALSMERGQDITRTLAARALDKLDRDRENASSQ